MLRTFHLFRLISPRFLTSITLLLPVLCTVPCVLGTVLSVLVLSTSLLYSFVSASSLTLTLRSQWYFLVLFRWYLHWAIYIYWYWSEQGEVLSVFTQYLILSISAGAILSIWLKGSEDRHGDIVYINILLLVGTKKQWEITREPENKKRRQHSKGVQ